MEAVAADTACDPCNHLGEKLTAMTGVRYDRARESAWWRDWWEKNITRFPDDVQKLRNPQAQEARKQLRSGLP